MQKTELSYKEKRLKKVLNNGLIPEQAETINNYYRYLVTQKNLKESSIMNRLQPVSLFGRYIKKPYNLINNEDVTKYFFFLMEQGGWTGKNVSVSTIALAKHRIKVFYRWLMQSDNIPSAVNFENQKIPSKDLKKIDLYKKDDILSLIKTATHSRDKAIIAILWDSACRISEILVLKIKDVVFDELGCIVVVSGKTGTRKIRLVEAAPYIKRWLNDHPLKDEPTSYFFISLRRNYGLRLSYSTAVHIVEHAKKRAKINKPNGLHLFRHSRLDYLAQRGWRERDLRIFAGWTRDSKMSDVYLHYDEEEVNDKVLEMHGLKKKDKSQENQIVLEPISCIICGKQNPADAKVCDCGTLLDKEVGKDKNNNFRDDVRELNELFKDENFIDFYKHWKRMKKKI